MQKDWEQFSMTHMANIAWDNNNKNNDNNDKNNPHLNFVKGTVLGDKEQGVGEGKRRKG